MAASIYESVYSFPSIRTYSSVLRSFYSINSQMERYRKQAQIDRGGTDAPSFGSLIHTQTIYDLLGKPLDNIPTFHIGGTNGKVY